MRLIVFRRADLQRILEHIERNVIAVISVVVVFIRAWWLSRTEYNLEIALARTAEIALSGPPVKCLLIVWPRRSPVHLITTRPEEIAQRLVCFGPNQIAVV